MLRDVRLARARGLHQGPHRHLARAQKVEELEPNGVPENPETLRNQG
jgi:hypothetical protein